MLPARKKISLAQRVSQERLRNMFKLPIFGKKKLLLSFEYGMTLAKTALENKHEITPELMEKAEVMLMGEFTTQTPTQLSIDMAQNVLSAFELDLSQ